MNDVLNDILTHKRQELVVARQKVSDDEMARAASEVPTPARGFRRALLEAPAPRIIAEIKRRSPSKGEIRADFDPPAIARAYTAAGAAALSVLTDERFFGGSLDIFRTVRETTALPLLRKDFVIDAYQIDEARAAGADAVLLIVGALDRSALARLRDHAGGLGMDALVEVHDDAELDVAAAIGADLVGVNNRNLRLFTTDLATTERLAPSIPRGAVLVSESGIVGPEDVERLDLAGAHAFLVGESLMREPDVGVALKRLRGVA
ncbi:MAG: indole-3-glycerol phosphate synthase TrpC [bacterium]|nr:indole-3-glycerol phosphate synthase TrpC [bacterium]MCP5066789.1 indole-3-glycerol phosphate synthase TrpC [bacterium]